MPVHFPEPWFYALQPGSVAAVAAEAAAATAATMAADAAAAEKKAAAEAAAAEAAANALHKTPFRGIPDYGMDANDALSPAYGGPGTSSAAAKSSSNGGISGGGGSSGSVSHGRSSKNNSGPNSHSGSKNSGMAQSGSQPSSRIELARLQAAMELGLMPTENHATGATSQPLPPAYKPPESMFYSAEEALAASFTPKADLLAPAKDVEAAAAAAEAEANTAGAKPNAAAAAEGSLTPNDVGWLKASVSALTTSLAALQSAAAASPAQGVLDTGGDGGKSSSSSSGPTKCLVAKVRGMRYSRTDLIDRILILFAHFLVYYVHTLYVLQVWSPQHKRMVCDPTGEKLTSKVAVGAHHDSKRAREKITTYERASSKTGNGARTAEEASGAASDGGQGETKNSGPPVDLVPGEQAGFGGGWRRRLSDEYYNIGANRHLNGSIITDSSRRQLFKDDAHEKLASDTAGLWVAAKRMNGGVSPPRGSEVYKRLYAKHDEQLRKKFNSVTFPSYSHLLDFSQFVPLPKNESNHTLASNETNETSLLYGIHDGSSSTRDSGGDTEVIDSSTSDAVIREDNIAWPLSADTESPENVAQNLLESALAPESTTKAASIDRDLAAIAAEEVGTVSSELPSSTLVSAFSRKCPEGASRRWDNRKKKMVCPHGNVVSSSGDRHSGHMLDSNGHSNDGEMPSGALVDVLKYNISIGIGGGSIDIVQRRVGGVVVATWAKTPLPRPSQALSDGLTCGAFTHVHTDWCRSGDDLLQVRPKWDPSGIGWQAYVCGGGGSSALLGYRPLESRAASVLKPLQTAPSTGEAPATRGSSSSSSSGSPSGDSGGGEAALLSCLGGRRLMFIGDSWARQLFLNVIEVIQVGGCSHPGLNFTLRTTHTCVHLLQSLFLSFSIFNVFIHLCTMRTFRSRLGAKQKTGLATFTEACRCPKKLTASLVAPAPGLTSTGKEIGSFWAMT